MRRFIVLLALLVAIPVSAADNWWNSYQRAMTAIEKQSWAAAEADLRMAIALEGKENASAVVSGRSQVYLPHYWLGVALYRQGKTDAALAEWKTSEAHQAIQKTAQYSELRRLVSGAQSARSQAENQASRAQRTDADAAIKRALSIQMLAMTEGADRSETFKSAKEKLQSALEALNRGGSDSRAYESAAVMASEAEGLFSRAVDEQKARRAAASRAPSGKAAGKPVDVVVDQVEVVIERGSQPPAPPVTATPVPEQAKKGGARPVSPVSVPVPGTGAVSPARGESPYTPPADTPVGIATSQPPGPAPDRSAVPAVEPGEHVALLVMKEMKESSSTSEVIRRGYIHFASGNVNAAEALMTAVIDTGQSSPEAYLMRGCARYTRSMMSRQKELLDSARRDFVAALRKKPSLRLDPGHFSPKLIGFFNQVRDEL